MEINTKYVLKLIGKINFMNYMNVEMIFFLKDLIRIFLKKK